VVVEVDRAQVLAYRIAAQGLDERRNSSVGVGELEVLDLGVQDSSAGSVKLALAARLPDLSPAELGAELDRQLTATPPTPPTPPTRG
jgi:hypothetical protein